MPPCQPLGSFRSAASSASEEAFTQPPSGKVTSLQQRMKKIAPNEFDRSLHLWSKSDFNKKYVLRSSNILGTGAFSKVYLGSDIARLANVAVKVVDRSTLCKEEEEEERLVAEIELLRELSHEHILSIHDAYCEAKSYHIVLEYMNGGDLLDIIEAENSLDEIKARGICYSIMSAITHLHSHSIAHRDIKPENILVSCSGDDLLVKLGDFGFSKREVTPNCLVTLCGTMPYVAPEIITSQPYGVKCDIWSAGVLTFVLMGGYQPFHGKNEDEIKSLIVKGDFNFDIDYWSHISDTAKDFIEHLLVVDPADRAEAEEMISHPWFSEDILLSTVSGESSKEKPVFFMIGSQRSGSNWLRTMLDQREDLVGPHPPHVMREFMPLIAQSKFGDLSQDENFNILVDHVCTFVERNQVPWNDKYGQRIIFCRQTVCDKAKASCKRIKLQEQGDLDNELYLLSIFDSLMDFFADANGKELWMCKSMGMSAYHTSLLKFYGKRRLRYIYLVRDPRDVAMSFMKTPVGDKHYYAIVKKWAKLQEQAIAILEAVPDIIFHIKYEDLLENKEDAISRIYDFIGDRRFGGVKRQASVMSIAPVAASVSQAKRGSESFKAHMLSQQFQNLCRGDSFSKEQMAKWKHPEHGLKRDDLIIIESLAYRAMKYFGYEAAHVKGPNDVLQFTEAQLEEFALLNKDGVEEMYEKLKKENVADYNRRVHQAEVLKMGAKRLSKRWSIDESFKSKMKKDAILEQLNNSDLVEGFSEKGTLEGFGTFVCGASSQKGYYPADPMKENQDNFDIRIEQTHNLFSVYDGHGTDGRLCSELCKTLIGDIYEERLSEGSTTKVAVTAAHKETHDILTKSAAINTELSGSTTVLASLKGSELTVAYAGDSAAIIGSKSNKRTPMLLTKSHDLTRPEEVARIERNGGLIMSTKEYDEIKDQLTRKRKSLTPQAGSIQIRSEKRSSGCRPTLNDCADFHQSMSDLMNFSISKHMPDDCLNQSLRKVISLAPKHSWISQDDEDYVPRIWSATSREKVPGVAFTRSLGDFLAHEIGVSNVPEFMQMAVQDDDVIIVASDGVTEYLDAEAIVKIVNEFDDPADAARKLVKTSAALWAEKNDYCDDITAIVIFIQEEKQVKLSRGSMFRRIQKQFPQLSSVSSCRFVKRMKRRKQSA